MNTMYKDSERNEKTQRLKKSSIRSRSHNREKSICI